MKKHLLYISLIYFGCNSQIQEEKSTEIEPANNIESVDSVDTFKFNRNLFDSIKTKSYCIVLEKMYDSIGHNKKFSFFSDTAYEFDYVKTRFLYKNDGFFTTLFCIYKFKSVSNSQEFFDDLFCKECLEDFGINKCPNYIVLDSTTIYWHHFNCSYAHLFNDLKERFINHFSFEFESNTRDSIVKGCPRSKTEFSPVEIVLAFKKDLALDTLHETNSKMYSDIVIKKETVLQGDQKFQIENVYTSQYKNTNKFIKYFTETKNSERIKNEMSINTDVILVYNYYLKNKENNKYKSIELVQLSSDSFLCDGRLVYINKR